MFLPCLFFHSAFVHFFLLLAFHTLFSAAENLLWTQISSLLCDELPPRVKKNWLALRSVILNLCKSEISASMLPEIWSSYRQWAIEHEELHGLKGGTPKKHFVFHLIADTFLWSVPTLHWCFGYEGKLGYYKAIIANRNGKGVHVSNLFLCAHTDR
jgi:hypothetical protein